VGEDGRAERGRLKGNPDLCCYLSSVADFVRATFSHKGRRKEEEIARHRTR
jgi:hypothetical protein